MARNKDRGATPPATDAGAATRTVQARSRAARDTSRSTVESSADEVGFTTVIGGERGKRSERTRSQQRILFQRSMRRPSDGYSSLCRCRRCEQGSRHTGPSVRPRTGRELMRGAGSGDEEGTIGTGKGRITSGAGCAR